MRIFKLLATNSPNRSGDGQHRLNIDFSSGSNRLQFQYLRVEMRFYAQWIFLSEVYFCGE